MTRIQTFEPREWYDAIEALGALHKAEVEADVTPLPPTAHRGMYDMLHEAGMLVPVGVFDGDAMVGYAIATISPNPHYDTITASRAWLYAWLRRWKRSARLAGRRSFAGMRRLAGRSSASSRCGQNHITRNILGSYEMAVASSTAALIGAAVAAGSGIAANVAQNKARGQARYAMHKRELQHQADLQNSRDQFSKMFDESQRVHDENMLHANRVFERDREFQEQQLLQGKANLHMQMQSLEDGRNAAERALNNSVAQMHRQINASERPSARYSGADKGVAGTLLTGPGGVKKEELKKGKNLLLGQ